MRCGGDEVLGKITRETLLIKKTSHIGEISRHDERAQRAVI